MKSIKLFLITLCLSQTTLAQFSYSIEEDNQWQFSTGIGISSQFDNQLSPYYRLGAEHFVSPKVQLFASISNSDKSRGDTFSIRYESYYNDGLIVGSNFTQTSTTTFSMINFGIGIRYTPHERVGLRLAPGITQITKGENIVTNQRIEVSSGRSSLSTTEYPIQDLANINGTLLGIDLGLDFSIVKWLSLNYNAHLRFTDVTKDATYGPQTDRIMQSTLSLNYVLK